MINHGYAPVQYYNFKIFNVTTAEMCTSGFVQLWYVPQYCNKQLTYQNFRHCYHRTSARLSVSFKLLIWLLSEIIYSLVYTGASPGFGRGGGQEFFSQIWKFACHEAIKWCNLVRFGVYFDQILSLKISKIAIFYIKNLKIAIFYIKNKYFRYTIAMG